MKRDFKTCIVGFWFIKQSRKKPKLQNTVVKTSVYGRQATLARHNATFSGFFVILLFETSLDLSCKKNYIKLSKLVVDSGVILICYKMFQKLPEWPCSI